MQRNFRAVIAVQKWSTTVVIHDTHENQRGDKVPPPPPKKKKKTSISVLEATSAMYPCDATDNCIFLKGLTLDVASSI